MSSFLRLMTLPSHAPSMLLDRCRQTTPDDGHGTSSGFFEKLKGLQQLQVLPPGSAFIPASYASQLWILA